MTKRTLSLLAVTAVLGLASPAAWSLCAGFTDVDSTPPFCQNVEWIKNRGVTLGCTSTTLYCPSDNVTRLQMAAFMNRLGTALTPVQLRVDTVTGAQDLDLAQNVVCQTANFVASTYPRRAFVDAVFTATATADVSFAADLVYTVDNGGTWVPMTVQGNRGSVLAGRWGSLSNIAHADVDANATVRFGVKLSRDSIPGSADLADSRCALRTLVYSRDGTSSPF